MHEMSIAMNLIETAEFHAKAQNAFRINEIEVEVGLLGGVMIESLEFCFASASRNTFAEGSHLKVIPIPGKGECLGCKAQFPIEAIYDGCPHCKEVPVRVLEGRELKVRAINVD